MSSTGTSDMTMHCRLELCLTYLILINSLQHNLIDKTFSEDCTRSGSLHAHKVISPRFVQVCSA